MQLVEINMVGPEPPQASSSASRIVVPEAGAPLRISLLPPPVTLRPGLPERLPVLANQVR
ncbi:MAG: hypothetical protein R3D34_15040 [Nitratireductor sp.]